MALEAGSRLGPYEVTAPIGEGGMGVVFRAHDVKLQRDVASKLLPDRFANDGQQFLIPRAESNSAEINANAPITIVLNWQAALGKK